MENKELKEIELENVDGGMNRIVNYRSPISKNVDEKMLIHSDVQGQMTDHGMMGHKIVMPNILNNGIPAAPNTDSKENLFEISNGELI